MVFKTLKEGLAGSSMASFGTLPVDDRWALVQYVLSLGSSPASADSPEDFAKAGIDSTGGGETEAPSISIAAAMKLMAEPTEPTQGVRVYGGMVSEKESGLQLGAQTYLSRCAGCHGEDAKGRLIVKNLGVNPKAFVSTRALSSSLPSLQSAEEFTKIVVEGIPGEAMPGAGDLGAAQIQELYQYVKALAARP